MSRKNTGGSLFKCFNLCSCQKKLELGIVKLGENRMEFERLLKQQSKKSPKLTRGFTNGIFYYMNRRMQREGYEMSDEHLAALRSEIERDGGLWYKLFAENSAVLNTTRREYCTPVFVMGQFFHWILVNRMKPLFYDK